jgi:DNA-binding GntR family transcriptional regulator
LNGTLAPGEIVNQVHIARQYGVSRTPVREALRMLQAEGLIEAQFQHRMRVTNVTPEEVDAVYATWILMQSLGVALTVPQVTASELDQIREALVNVNSHTPLHAGTQNEWNHYHVIFHQLLILHAGPVITSSINTCWSRSERARRAYLRSAPQSWIDSEDEHNAIVDAYVEKSVARAVHITSRQLARNALSVIGHIDPGYEPRAIRQALNLSAQPGNQEAVISAQPLAKNADARSRSKVRL